MALHLHRRGTRLHTSRVNIMHAQEITCMAALQSEKFETPICRSERVNRSCEALQETLG